jgi:hypothetical protein
MSYDHRGRRQELTKVGNMPGDGQLAGPGVALNRLMDLELVAQILRQVPDRTRRPRAAVQEEDDGTPVPMDSHSDLVGHGLGTSGRSRSPSEGLRP